MKILHVFDHSLPLHSGYSFRSASILREQRALGWETVQVTTPKHTHPGPSEEQVEDLYFYRTAVSGRAYGEVPVLREGALIAATARRIEEVAARERPDLLHAHSPVLNALACLRAGRRLGLPTVYEVRGFWEDAAVDHGTTSEGSLRYRLSRVAETFALRRCNAITTICEGLRREMLGRGLPAGKITLIPNAVDTEKFTFGRTIDADLQAQLDLAGRTVLGFIGSFYAYEGLDLLIRALPVIRNRCGDVVLLLVGGGPAEPELRGLIGQLSLTEHVRLLGRVPHAEVARYYDLVDVFVYPRHRMRLTELVTPLKPLEAMAHGSIVIASDVGGHRELIRDRDTGYLFDADRVEALVECVATVLADRENWPRVRRAGRRFVETERTWSHSVANYRGAYAQALAGVAPAEAA